MSNFSRAIAEALTAEYEASVPSAPEHEFSQEFLRKMDKLIKRRELPFYMLINTAGKRVAGIVIGVLIALTATIISVDALREGFLNFITTIFDDHSVVRPIGKENAPESIEEQYAITADLSEYTLVYEEHRATSVFMDYAADDKIIRFCQYTKGVAVNHNTEDAELVEIDINGFKAIYFYDNHNYHNITWDNGDYVIALISNIEQNELISIAKSVEKVE